MTRERGGRWKSGFKDVVEESVRTNLSIFRLESLDIIRGMRLKVSSTAVSAEKGSSGSGMKCRRRRMSIYVYIFFRLFSIASKGSK